MNVSKCGKLRYVKITGKWVSTFRLMNLKQLCLLPFNHLVYFFFLFLPLIWKRLLPSYNKTYFLVKWIASCNSATQIAIKMCKFCNNIHFIVFRNICKEAHTVLIALPILYSVLYTYVFGNKIADILLQKFIINLKMVF